MSSSTGGFLSGFSRGFSDGDSLARKKKAKDAGTKETGDSVKAAVKTADVDLDALTDIGANMKIGDFGREASSFITPVDGYTRGRP